jgi:hypothetical protein
MTRQTTQYCSPFFETTMSLDLPLVSQIMYLREGHVYPGDEKKVERYEKK